MSIILDLSGPRRYMQAKYDDMMFQIKLNPLKINKNVLITSGIILMAIVLTGDVVCAADMNSEEYKYLINHYVNDLNFPKDSAINLLNKCRETDINEMYTRLKASDDTINDIRFCLNTGEKVIDVCIEASKYVTFKD